MWIAHTFALHTVKYIKCFDVSTFHIISGSESATIHCNTNKVSKQIKESEYQDIRWEVKWRRPQISKYVVVFLYLIG